DYTSIGTANIREVHSIVDLPIYCIGGIKRDNLPEVLAAGAQRVVIVSSILQSGQSADYCRSCKAALQ
ncbi:MAG: thiamine phosphate synthase, partial [Spartobacteria bacterium]